MIHNITEGLGIAAPLAEGGEGARIPLPTLVGLAAIAGAPAILGAWIGGYSGSDVLAVLFFAAAAGAALQVVVEVDALRRAPRPRRAHLGLRDRRLSRRARGDVPDRAPRRLDARARDGPAENLDTSLIRFRAWTR